MGCTPSTGARSAEPATKRALPGSWETPLLDDWLRAAQTVAALELDVDDREELQACVARSRRAVALGYGSAALSLDDCRTGRQTMVKSAWKRLGVSQEDAATGCFLVEGAASCREGLACSEDPRPRLSEHGFALDSVIVGRGGTDSDGRGEHFLALRRASPTAAYRRAVEAAETRIRERVDARCRIPVPNPESVAACLETLKELIESTPEALFGDARPYEPHGGVVVRSSGCEAAQRQLQETSKRDLLQTAGVSNERALAYVDAALAVGVLDRCAEPRSPQDCQGATTLRESLSPYLGFLPGLRERFDRVAAVLEQAGPALARYADDEAWGKADAGSCADAPSLWACVNVDDYVLRFPTGRHVAEAKAAKKQAEPNLEKLRKARSQGGAVDCRYASGPIFTTMPGDLCFSGCSDQNVYCLRCDMDRRCACVVNERTESLVDGYGFRGQGEDPEFYDYDFGVQSYLLHGNDVCGWSLISKPAFDKKRNEKQ
jgi:hypothetical protein